MSRVTVKTWLNRICAIGAVLYPLIAHLSVYFHERQFAAGYLMALFVIYLQRFQDQKNRITRLAIAIFLLLGMMVLAKRYGIAVWLYIPPILLPLWLSTTFLLSLNHQDTAVITRVAAMMEGGKLEEKHLGYTRMLTLIWGVILLLLAGEAILLAWLAPYITWSWWANIGNYLILLALLLIEIPIRWVWLGKAPRFGNMLKVMLTRPWNVRD
jgi:uncharacterized membrane protein